ncbi:MAG: EAL domain-containing protein [Gammaproteobacteria bacterium]|nr:EAL domain-containing protein [Gammaproteobacteria bacterium]
MRKLFKSYRSKVIVLTLLVVLGSQIANMLAVLFAMNRDTTVRTENRLENGGNVFEEIVLTRGSLLEKTVRPLVEDFAFKSAVATGDTETIRSALVNNARRADADIALLMSLDGTVIASTDQMITSNEQSAKLIANTRSGLLAGHRAYEMLTMPINAPNVIGWVSVGYIVDGALAERIAGLTGLETTFLGVDSDGRHKLLGSSLSRDQRTLIINTALRLSAGTDQTIAASDMEAEYITRRRAFLPNDPSVFVLMQEPLKRAMAPYKMLQGSMLHALTTTLLCALIMAYFMSRSITRPIHALLLAAHHMQVGNYKKKFDINTNDEFKDLAKAFDSMREGIAEREQRIVYQARFDGLTGLPNRIQAMELLRDSLRACAHENESMVVIIMHLQRFREIQSSLGHEIGDEVLRQTAQRLNKALPEDFALARLEGDQFLIVAPDTDSAGGEELAHKLESILDTGLTVQSVNVTLDACIGLCVFPEHGRQPDELLRRAAVAKNDAQHSQQRIRIYQNGREARHVRQLAILGDLRRATQENELRLFLQPKITLKNSQVCGAEALLRWEHPELGNINPKEFIPLAESAGSISSVTSWVLHHSIHLARSWKELGVNLPIAVNLSGQDLQNDRLPEQIRAELDAHDMDASCLILEITEEAAARDIDRAIYILNRLREMGISTSMDDFGTGYSTLSNLKNLPMDELKIDRSFVTYLPDDRENAAIVRTVIELAHDLGLEVVAEGVETTAALRWLREEGCERAQGYYLSKPMPAERFVGWLRSWEHLAGEDESDSKTAESLVLSPRLIRQ